MAPTIALLIAKAQELHAAGTQYLMLDLQHVNYMSSAGLVALHSIGKSLAGEAPPDPDAGWDAYHAVQRDRPAGAHAQFKLLNPQPRVEKLLEMAGMSTIFEVYQRSGRGAGLVLMMDCRVGCGACCVVPSISSAIPGMPHGKPAGVRCAQLTSDNRCQIFGHPDRPGVCLSLQPSLEMCGTIRR